MSNDDHADEPSNDIHAAGPSKANYLSQTCGKTKRVQKQKQLISDSSSSKNEDNILLESDTDPDFQELEDEREVMLQNTYVPKAKDYVIVKYEGEYWPGIVSKVSASGAEVSCMAKSGKLWNWPKHKDILNYEFCDIVGKIDPPVKVSSTRDLYTVKELLARWGN